MTPEQPPDWILPLDLEDLTFIRNFVLASGSLKKMSDFYQVSYPTVRLRLDKLIQKIQINEDEAREPFIAFIKNLTLNDKIDLDTAKLIINAYQKEQKP